MSTTDSSGNLPCTAFPPTGNAVVVATDSSKGPLNNGDSNGFNNLHNMLNLKSYNCKTDTTQSVSQMDDDLVILDDAPVSNHRPVTPPSCDTNGLNSGITPSTNGNNSSNAASPRNKFEINDKVRSSFKDTLKKITPDIMSKIQENTPSLGTLLAASKNMDTLNKAAQEERERNNKDNISENRTIPSENNPSSESSDTNTINIENTTSNTHSSNTYVAPSTTTTSSNGNAQVTLNEPPDPDVILLDGPVEEPQNVQNKPREMMGKKDDLTRAVMKLICDPKSRVQSPNSSNNSLLPMDTNKSNQCTTGSDCAKPVDSESENAHCKMTTSEKGECLSETKKQNDDCVICIDSDIENSFELDKSEDKPQISSIVSNSSSTNAIDKAAEDILLGSDSEEDKRLHDKSKPTENVCEKMEEEILLALSDDEDVEMQTDSHSNSVNNLDSDQIKSESKVLELQANVTEQKIETKTEEISDKSNCELEDSSKLESCDENGTENIQNNKLEANKDDDIKTNVKLKSEIKDENECIDLESPDEDENECLDLKSQVKDENECSDLKPAVKDENDCIDLESPDEDEDENECLDLKTPVKDENECLDLKLSVKDENDCRDLKAPVKDENECLEMKPSVKDENDCIDLEAPIKEKNECRDLKALVNDENDCIDVDAPVKDNLKYNSDNKESIESGSTGTKRSIVEDVDECSNSSIDRKRPAESPDHTENTEPKRSRLDMMIGKLGSQIGVEPESVEDEQDVDMSEAGSDEEDTQDSDDSKTSATMSTQENDDDEEEEGSEVKVKKRKRKIKVTEKELEFMVRTKVKAYLRLEKLKWMQETNKKIEELQTSNEMWKSSYKELEKHILDVTVLQQTHAKRKAKTAALRQISTKNIGIQVDGIKTNLMNHMSQQGQSAPATVTTPSKVLIAKTPPRVPPVQPYQIPNNPVASTIGQKTPPPKFITTSLPPNMVPVLTPAMQSQSPLVKEPPKSRTCCVAYGCWKEAEDKVSLYQFPKDESLRHFWVDFVRQRRAAWEAEDNSRLCSDHFALICFPNHLKMMIQLGISIKGDVELVKGSIPTIYKDTMPGCANKYIPCQVPTQPVLVQGRQLTGAQMAAAAFAPNIKSPVGIQSVVSSSPLIPNNPVLQNNSQAFAARNATVKSLLDKSRGVVVSTVPSGSTISTQGLPSGLIPVLVQANTTPVGYSSATTPVVYSSTATPLVNSSAGGKVISSAAKPMVNSLPAGSVNTDSKFIDLTDEDDKKAVAPTVIQNQDLMNNALFRPMLNNKGVPVTNQQGGIIFNVQNGNPRLPNVINGGNKAFQLVFPNGASQQIRPGNIVTMVPGQQGGYRQVTSNATINTLAAQNALNAGMNNKNIQQQVLNQKTVLTRPPPPLLQVAGSSPMATPGNPTMVQRSVPTTLRQPVTAASSYPSLQTATQLTSQSSNAPIHPAALPLMPTNQVKSGQKPLPPKPTLKISRVAQGIVLSWNMTLKTTPHADISSYQLFAYQEGNTAPNTSLWKKVGDVKALPLPMACTLTQFQEGNKYHFAVRAVDVHNRVGPFSDPSTIHLTKKD